MFTALKLSKIFFSAFYGRPNSLIKSLSDWLSFKEKNLKKEDFARFYSKLSNVELLKIIEEKHNYEPPAIEVARQILEERKYSNDDLIIARSEINDRIKTKRERQEKINHRLNKFSDIIDDNFGIKQKTPKRLLNLFCIAMFLFSLIAGLFSIRTLAILFTSKSTGYVVAILLYLLQLLIIYLLYRRTHWGWVLVAGIYTLFAVGDIQSIFFLFKEQAFFPGPSPSAVFVNLCFHAGVVIFLNVRSIHEQFNISRDKRFTTIIVSAIIAGFFFFIL